LRQACERQAANEDDGDCGAHHETTVAHERFSPLLNRQPEQARTAVQRVLATRRPTGRQANSCRKSTLLGRFVGSKLRLWAEERGG
jgi:hypothetical protein